MVDYTPLERLRRERVESCEKALVRSKLELEQLVQREGIAHERFSEYGQKLPSLIDDLYTSIMDRCVDVTLVTEVASKEAKLRQVLREYELAWQQAQKEVETGHGAVDLAREDLLKATRKEQGLQEVLSAQAEAEKQQEEKLLAKQMDEFATVAYVR